MLVDLNLSWCVAKLAADDDALGQAGEAMDCDVSAGLIEIQASQANQPNQVTILADRAIRAEDLDEKVVSKAMASASAQLQAGRPGGMIRWRFQNERRQQPQLRLIRKRKHRA